MRVPLTLLAGLLTIGGAALAEPSKNSTATAPQPEKLPTKIVLASADKVHATGPASAAPSATQAKRPAPRVTTCRCGDPADVPVSEEQ
jgi:hypothetical protein